MLWLPYSFPPHPLSPLLWGGGGGKPPLLPRHGPWGAMRQRILGSHTPPFHRRMVITTQFSVLPCCTAAQTILYHSRWLLIVLWPWPSVHLGQLAPTTLPQCRVVSNPCSAGLSLSLSLAFRSVGFALFLCASPTSSTSVSRPPSLSVSPSLSPRVSLSLSLLALSFSPSPHPPQGLFLCLCLILHPPAGYPLSGISPFAWRCAQQRVEEPYSVSGYRVCLPEERSLEQP